MLGLFVHHLDHLDVNKIVIHFIMAGSPLNKWELPENSLLLCCYFVGSMFWILASNIRDEGNISSIYGGDNFKTNIILAQFQLQFQFSLWPLMVSRGK